MSTASRLDKVRARLDLPRVRRASGLLDGRHRSIYTGHGQDFDDMVEYHPGDDVGDIDWKSSARAGHPIIRRFVRESNLSMVLAVDTGRNMAATAPSGERKAEVALFAADVVAYLARSRGDLVALVAGDEQRLTQVPARGGTGHLELLLRLLERDLRLDAPASDLGRVLDRTFSWLGRRSLIVVITDEARPGPEHEDTLRRLRTRHEVMVIAVADATAADGGPGAVADVDGGPALPAFVRADRRLAAEARAAVDRRRSEVRAMLRRRGIEHVVAGSSDEVVDALIDVFRRQRRARG
ncbi:DUF58 domain-containing protein [Georgenia faecalis]|uniref:DUF58 domain-containing protein n=1 Tax=Georgenia faecalis TaxID=2483799 RepID=A0ABV9D9E6_9MICO|nr:DUF58 domain-containing protein [Georgenia faecalis]